MDTVTASCVPEGLTPDPLPLIVQFGLKLPVVLALPDTIPPDQLLPELSATDSSPELKWM
jgi:hypothetical protein